MVVPVRPASSTSAIKWLARSGSALGAFAMCWPCTSARESWDAPPGLVAREHRKAIAVNPIPGPHGDGRQVREGAP